MQINARPFVQIALTVLVASILSGTRAARADDGPTAAEQAAIAEAMAPSMVRVEYMLQYDKGEAPRSAGWISRCPNCGGFHRSDSEKVVRQERPMEVAGFLISPTTVLTSDPMVHPRFIRSIAVAFGDEVIEARAAGYARGQTAMLLELDQPLTHARPLEFDPQRSAKLAATHTKENGEWTISLKPAAAVVSARGERRFVSVPSFCILADEQGTPLGISMNDELPADDSWKGSPLDWPMIAADEMLDRLADMERRVDQGLLAVTLNFRSPRTPAARQFYRGHDDEDAAVQHAIGVLVDQTTLLVLSELRPNVTARLERIRVQRPGGPSVPASFAHTLTDYGALVATLDEPLEGVVPLSAEPILDYRNMLLLAAEVNLQGERKVSYFGHRRIASFDTGWRRQLYPVVPGADENLFLFDESGALVALPITRRERVMVEERWSRQSSPVLTAATYLQQVLADVGGHVDPSNVPLTEEQENRLAWLGIELQALDTELARINEVADLTSDGESGALVTYVYPGSPADRAGIEPGQILLRLHIEGQPRPLDVKLDRWGGYGDEPFPWDQLGMIPEQYFEQIPHPWPSAENTFTRALTNIGFGQPFVADFFANGQIVSHPFTVEQSPSHYDSALRVTSELLGLTVRDMTYEVRRYFQRQADDPGVIISKIEMGSRASIAGLKPFEYITHVNDVPVHTVRQFEELISTEPELRLSVRRMAQGRIAKIRLPADAVTPAAAPVVEEQQPEADEEQPAAEVGAEG